MIHRTDETICVILHSITNITHIAKCLKMKTKQKIRVCTKLKVNEKRKKIRTLCAFI